MRTIAALFLGFLAIGSSASGKMQPEIEVWGKVLSAHCMQGGTDYASLSKDRRNLDRYLESLGNADPDSWPDPEALAFWINAYNAVVVFRVLERYPGLPSVKAVQGLFDENTFPVAGKDLTLDEIESAGRAFGDPRIHFAVNCASTSCPDLLCEPYRGNTIEAQLEQQTNAFLADEKKGLRYLPKANKLQLSSIFSWYGGDFASGGSVVAFVSRQSIIDGVLPYLPDDLAKRIEASGPRVEFLDYDWSLNDRP